MNINIVYYWLLFDDSVVKYRQTWELLASHCIFENTLKIGFTEYNLQKVLDMAKLHNIEIPNQHYKHAIDIVKSYNDINNLKNLL